MDIRLIDIENVPCWMKLVWQTDPPTISILVHREIVSLLHTETDTWPHANSLRNENSGDSIFSPSREGGWGFDQCLAQAPETVDGFMPFAFEIPQIKYRKSEPCRACNGSGQNSQTGNTCLYCFGAGHESYIERRRIWAISASLSLLTDKIGRFPPEGDTSARTPQLLSFETFTSPKYHGIKGRFGIELVDWLRRLNTETLDEPAAAILNAWDRMLGADKIDRMHISVRSNKPNGYLHLCCPNGGLSPTRYGKTDSRGYEFADFDLEQPFQQIAILAGLAALETQARRELGL